MTHAAAVKEVSAAAEVGDGAPARWEGDRPGQRPHYQSTVADQGRPDAVLAACTNVTSPPPGRAGAGPRRGSRCSGGGGTGRRRVAELTTGSLDAVGRGPGGRNRGTGGLHSLLVDPTAAAPSLPVVVAEVEQVGGGEMIVPGKPIETGWTKNGKNPWPAIHAERAGKLPPIE